MAYDTIRMILTTIYTLPLMLRVKPQNISQYAFIPAHVLCHALRKEYFPDLLINTANFPVIHACIPKPEGNAELQKTRVVYPIQERHRKESLTPHRSRYDKNAGCWVNVLLLLMFL